MPIPSNNDFSNAIVISGSSGFLSGQNNISATFQSGEPQGSAGCTVWYEWQAPANDYYQFYTIYNSNAGITRYPQLQTVLQVYESSSFPLTEVSYLSPQSSVVNYGGSNFGSQVNFGPVAVSSSFFIRVDGYGSASAYNQNFGYGNSGSQGYFNLSWQPFRFSHLNTCAGCSDDNRGVGYSCLRATASIPDVAIFNDGPNCFGLSPNPWTASFPSGGLWYGFDPKPWPYGTYRVAYCGGAYNCFYFPATPTGSQPNGAQWIVEGGGADCNTFNPYIYFWFMSASVSMSTFVPDAGGGLAYVSSYEQDVNYEYNCRSTNFLHTGGDISMQWIVPDPNGSFDFLCYQNGIANPSFTLYELVPVITAFNSPGACAFFTDSGSAAQAYFNINNQNDYTWSMCSITLDTTFGGITAATTWTGSLSPGLNTISPIFFTSSLHANCTARLLINSPNFALGTSSSIDFYLGPTFNVVGPNVITCRGGPNGAHFTLTYTGAWKVNKVNYFLQSNTGAPLLDVFPDNTCNLSTLTSGSSYIPFQISACACVEDGTPVQICDFYTIRFFGTNRQISASFFCGNTHGGTAVVGGINNI